MADSSDEKSSAAAVRSRHLQHRSLGSTKKLRTASNSKSTARVSKSALIVKPKGTNVKVIGGGVRLSSSPKSSRSSVKVPSDYASSSAISNGLKFAELLREKPAGPPLPPELRFNLYPDYRMEIPLTHHHLKLSYDEAFNGLPVRDPAHEAFFERYPSKRYHNPEAYDRWARELEAESDRVSKLYKIWMEEEEKKEKAKPALVPRPDPLADSLSYQEAFNWPRDPRYKIFDLAEVPLSYEEIFAWPESLRTRITTA